MKLLPSGCILGLALIATSAGAADLAPYKAPPPPAYFSWTGFYLGANAGYGWGDANDRMRLGGSWLTDGTGDNFVVEPFGNGRLKPRSFVGGVQVGYNQQFGQVVVGVETDVNVWDMRKDFSSGIFTTPAGNLYTVNSSYQNTWFVSERLRVGYTFDQVLVYATGGFTIAEQSFTQTIQQVNVLFNQAALVTQRTFGWTGGGGIEYALARQLSVKAEYLYVDLRLISAASFGDVAPNYIADHSARLRAHIARFGFNYHLFDPGPLIAKN